MNLSSLLIPAMLHRAPWRPRLTPWRRWAAGFCALGLSVAPIRAATNAWIGPGAGLNAWSNGANWTNLTLGTSGSPPAAGDEVKFFDTGATTVSNVNNVVDGGFTVALASLQFGNTNNTHTTLIAPGQTLSLTGPGGLIVGTPGDVGVAKNLTNTFTGPGGTLVVSNPTAVIALNQGSATGVTGTRANLNLAGLDTFIANVSRLGLGSTALPNPGGASQREAGALFLARTNLITLTYTDTLANYQTAGKNNALEMSRNPGNNAGILSLLALGQTNAFFVDSLGIGRDKASASSAAWIGFNAAFLGSNPVARFRGAGGDASRVTWWAIGDMNSSASSAQVSVGTNDFTGGTVDALVNVVSLARDCSPSHTATANIVGTLTFSAGTVDANTIYVGNQSLGPSTSTSPMLGYLNVNGPGATLKANSNLVLGYTVQTSVAAQKTAGTLNINGGTVLANAVSVGISSTNNVINLVSGTLIVTNTLATSNASGLASLNLSNATLGLSVPADGSLRALTQVFKTTGATNLIKLDPAPVIFASYPQQFPLIKYTTWTGSNTFGLASVPPWAPGATVVSNGASKSLDLVLSYDPRPVITNVAGLPTAAPANPGPGNDVVLSIGLSPTTALPVGYQWLLGGSPLADGANADGSTNSGSATAAFTIFNAQVTTTGNYSVVITNVYGAVTSSVLALVVSTNAVPPTISGSGSVTVIQGNTATLATTVSGKPVPTLQWRFNNVNLVDGPTGNGDFISGTTSSLLTISNAQYPASQGVYSLIASNSAGMATNFTTVSVIVRPAITTQPQNLTVTNAQTATLQVVATGVPTPTYQWFKNGSPISPAVNATATNATFTIAGTSPADTATYFVQVSNTAGATNSVSVKLTVNSTMSVSALAPANGATGVCYDTPLYLTFDRAALLNTSGRIRIFNATNTTGPVDTLDLSLNTASGTQARSLFPGDGQGFNYYPVIITGATASIYPHSGVMTSNQTYFVLVDSGAFTDTAGAFFAGIGDTNAWRFSTKTTGPANPTNLVVAADGSGDFVTVQGAADSVPANNTTPTLLTIRNGNYVELVNLSSKHNLTLRGQSRGGVVIGYANNANINNSTHNRMAFKVNANDIALDNLTITNRTPQGGSQAEALMIETSAARIIINNANVASYQDTLLANTATSKAYFNRSLIQGDVDFIWGGGNLFFTNCEVRWLLRPGNGSAQGPNPSPSATEITSNGFSFVNCALAAPPGATSDVVGRTRSIAGGNTALIGCLISTNIGGWASDALPTSNYRNWYYACSNLETSGFATLSNGIALASSDPNIALASNATAWLYGWQPQLSPNIISQPAGTNVIVGQAATFTVTATGIPDPTYQWINTSGPIAGATGSSLTIPNVKIADGDTYAVIVSNIAGVVTSTPALLIISNRPPVAASPSAATPQQTALALPVAKLVGQSSDPDGDAFLLTAVSPTSTNNGTVVLASGIITYTPPANYAGSDLFTYTLTDARGAAGLGQVFVTVTSTNAGSLNIVIPPTLLTNGHFLVGFAGIPNYTYRVDRATNAAGPWEIGFTNLTAGPDGRFQLDDPNVPPAPTRFYRTAHP